MYTAFSVDLYYISQVYKQVYGSLIAHLQLPYLLSLLLTVTLWPYLKGNCDRGRLAVFSTTGPGHFGGIVAIAVVVVVVVIAVIVNSTAVVVVW